MSVSSTTSSTVTGDTVALDGYDLVELGAVIPTLAGPWSRCSPC